MVSASLDLTQLPLVDNHAHSLKKNFLKLSKTQFRSCFTESSQDKVFEKDVPHSLSYLHLIKCLKSIFDFDTEDEYLKLRNASLESAHVKSLFEKKFYKSILIDDGYDKDSMITLDEFEEIANCKMYRILRIETVLENLISKHDSASLETILDELVVEISEAKNLVGLKTIVAYRGGLDLTFPSSVEAQASLDAEFIRLNRGLTKPRLAGDPHHHYFLLKVFELASELNLPVQVHCGFGDVDLDLGKSNPVCLTQTLKMKELANTNFVLLHCYPYVREAGYLASLFHNVYLDLSLAPIMVSGRIKTLYLEALALAPINKILAGSDGHSVPEMHWYGALMTRLGLTNALRELVDDGMMDIVHANNYATKVLAENACDLYKIS